jgi:tetratricopeptide (TPR) repeat protein
MRKSMVSESPAAIAALVIIAAMVMLVLAGHAAGQVITKEMKDNTLRDVRSMARYGNYEMALERLEWLYKGLPQDEAVVVSFFDFLVERGMYERAREVMETYLDFRPTYVGGMAKLADLYFKMEENEEARALLERFIETGHDRAWAYEMAAQTYLNAGLADDALAVIGDGRQHHKNPAMLYAEAAQAYMRKGMIADAVNEYLRAVEAELLVADVATGRIVAVAAEPDAREAVVAVLEEAVDAGVAGLVPLTALWQLSMADGDCARGLSEVSRIVEADRTLIGLLVNAAREFERNECFGECAEAYGLAAQMAGNSEDAPDFLLARGLCQERRGDLDGAIATYMDFAAAYSGSRRALDGYLALARAYRAAGEWDEALLQADKAVAARGAAKSIRRAVLLKGDCLVMLGRFDEAKQTYDLVRPDWDDFQAQSAYYNLGEIAFYEHEFEAALSYFNVAMAEYPGEALANDAVERLILIRGSRSGEEYAPELGKFADAALLERRHKPDEAIALLRTTAAAGPPELRTQSLKNLIRIYLAMQNYEEALGMCRIASETAESHWSPVALETAGDIYLHLGMLDDAIAAFEDVIVRYPNSVSAGDARRKLDSVRRGVAD